MAHRVNVYQSVHWECGAITPTGLNITRTTEYAHLTHSNALTYALAYANPSVLPMIKIITWQLTAKAQIIDIDHYYNENRQWFNAKTGDPI